MLRILLWVALLVSGFLHSACCADDAAADDKPSVPQWIWVASPAGDSEMAWFRATFDVADPKAIKSALLAASCDNHVSVFMNGQQVVEHGAWEEAVGEDVTKRLIAGKNVLAFRCKNEGGPAGLIAQLTLRGADDNVIKLVSGPHWLAAKDPKENWREADYDETGWKPAVSLGEWGVQPWGKVSLDGTLTALATTEDAIQTLPGFKVELLYSVPKSSQGSWVCMTADPKGRLVVSDQYGGLYRVTPGEDAAATQVEKLEVGMGECQGLLFAYDSLYAVVNGSAAQGSGLYRLRDTNGDDQFDEVLLLKRLNGGGEHGPHAIRLGPDGLLYVLAGNHTDLPEGVSADSPTFNYAEDHLLPRNPDGNGHATGRMAPGGWVLRTDRDGQHWDLFCAGFRNPYDIAFNSAGELFTYDADMEWDTGTPWYRPTRVNHCVSGAEFGWRYGTGKWPAYYPDSVGAVVDIGLGSPTGIEFGSGAKFPEKYQKALFINDWTYGKIYAVHLKPQGATYTGEFEPFIVGRPLPVTDLCVNHDGALYFTIGGRRTQSGLYRVTYAGDESTAPAKAEKPNLATSTRRLLESYHGRQAPQAVDECWEYLNHSDRSLRYAARVAIERQPPKEWHGRAFDEKRTTAAIGAMLAVARTGDKTQQAAILEKLNSLPFERLTEEQFLDALRAYQLAYVRLGGIQSGNAAVNGAVVERLAPLFPHQSEFVSRELCQVLTYLSAPGIAQRAMQQLKQSQTQQDQLFYAFVLRNLQDGWTPDLLREYYSWLNLAEFKYRGGASFQKFIQQIRQDAAAKLTPEDKAALADVIENKNNVEVVKLETTRQFVHNWQMSDLASRLGEVERGRSFERGRAAFEAAQCFKCHRFKGEGGDTGPDLTGVGGRFKPDYLLEALLAPSKVVSDQYQNTVIETSDGEIFTGRVIDENDEVLRIRTDPFARQPVEVQKSAITARAASPLSEMPIGLINVLTPEEILDLIAFMRSAGDPADKAFGQ